MNRKGMDHELCVVTGAASGIARAIAERFMEEGADLIVADYNLELAKYDFAMPATLDDTEIAAILEKVDEMISWGNDIKDYALQQAQSGVHFEGWKIVEGRSNRKYTDENAIADTVKDAGFNPYEKKLLGITAMSTLLGKKKFEELLGGLIYKPPGKPTLVPESDKRPAMNTAKDDFKE